MWYSGLVPVSGQPYKLQELNGGKCFLPHGHQTIAKHHRYNAPEGTRREFSASYHEVA